MGPGGHYDLTSRALAAGGRVVRLCGSWRGCCPAAPEAEADEDHLLTSGDHATGLPPPPGRFAMSEFGAGCVHAMRAGESWSSPTAATTTGWTRRT